MAGSLRFTEKQTAEIMRRAAEIQAQGASSGGVSEDELRAAARELGIQGPALDAALNSMDAPAAGRAGLFGGPFRHEVDVVFDGAIDDERWEEVVADLRRTFGETGAVDRRGSTYEWSGAGGGIDYNTVTIRQTGGAVRLSATSESSGAGVIGYLLMVIPLFVGVAVTAKSGFLGAWSGAAIGAWIGALFLGARAGTSWASRRREKRLAQLAARLRGLLAQDAQFRERLVEAEPVEAPEGSPEKIRQQIR